MKFDDLSRLKIEQRSRECREIYVDINQSVVVEGYFPAFYHINGKISYHKIIYIHLFLVAAI